MTRSCLASLAKKGRRQDNKATTTTTTRTHNDVDWLFLAFRGTRRSKEKTRWRNLSRRQIPGRRRFRRMRRCTIDINSFPRWSKGMPIPFSAQQDNDAVLFRETTTTTKPTPPPTDRFRWFHCFHERGRPAVLKGKWFAFFFAWSLSQKLPKKKGKLGPLPWPRPPRRTTFAEPSRAFLDFALVGKLVCQKMNNK